MAPELAEIFASFRPSCKTDARCGPLRRGDFRALRPDVDPIGRNEHPAARFQPNTGQTPEWNRGAYLVEALGHCGECHTPRNLLYGLSPGRKFAGAIINGWKAYNITSDPAWGIGAWSDAQLTDYLSSGHAQGRSSAAGPMGEAVENSLRFLGEDDIGAMAAYLKAAVCGTY
jgi:mono/diheme cytochrome c family protein